MSFLNQVRSMQLPPVKNVLNVAMQTARQQMPGKPNKGEYEQPAGNLGGGAPPIPPRPQNVRFADTDGKSGLNFICSGNLIVWYFRVTLRNTRAESFPKSKWIHATGWRQSRRW